MPVFDSSVMLNSLFPDEMSDRSVELMLQMQSTTVHVPSIWPLEITNALITSEKRGRISATLANEALQLVSEMRVVIHPPRLASELTPLAWMCRLFDLTAYDAEYLDLAFRSGLPLASFDDKLIRAAKSLGVELL